VAWDLGLDGKTALVTGASSGIGRAVAKALTAEGVRIAGVGRNEAALDGLVRELGPQRFVAIVADLATPGAVTEAATAAMASLGHVDLLVNDAGAGFRGDAVSASPAEWETTFAVNVDAAFWLCRAIIPGMLALGGGTIVNVASVAGLVAIPDRAAYCASKAALIAFTRSLAVDYAARGIRANCIAPGTTDTPWVDRIVEGRPDAEALRAAFSGRQLIGRLARPDEIADGIVFLTSARSSFMHGATLVVDGGWSIY
jgi:NAD(P)-dependent dehydrogenase (short-subunit alcohol dehydrogenase family)